MGVSARVESLSFKRDVSCESMLECLVHYLPMGLCPKSGNKLTKIGKKSDISIFSVLLEDSVAAHVVLDVDGRGAKQSAAALPYISDDSGLCADGCVVGDGYVSYDAHLSGYDAVPADFR